MEIIEHYGKSLKYLTVEPDGYDSTRQYPMVILLHGYGAHMGDLTGLSPFIDKTRYLYVLPNAPIPIESEYGTVGYAWMNLSERNEGTNREAEEAERKLEVFFEDVVEKYQYSFPQVVVVGFSQGGMMTYQWGISNPQRFLGLASLSSMIQDESVLLGRLPCARDQSIFVVHGTDDQLIPVEDGRRAQKFLLNCGYSLDYKEYVMGHQITLDVMTDLGSWIRRVLGPSTQTEG